MNVASAQLDIPLVPFSAAVFVGLTPYNFLSCKAGVILSELTSTRVMDATTTMWLCVIGVSGFVLPIVVRRLRKKSHVA